MFLSAQACYRLNCSFPRMRGDVPNQVTPSFLSSSFSPHARGCSVPHGEYPNPVMVFPACAGMFPPLGTHRHRPPSFPRMRGDVPGRYRIEVHCSAFSPHARGCSVQFAANLVTVLVFPACAGMFLIHTTPNPVNPSFPRMRGDVPWDPGAGDGVPGFSPHARGCSVS